MKKIVMLRSNPINPDPRVEKEVSALMDAGHSVTILAWDRDNDDGYKEKTIFINEAAVSAVKFGYAATYGEGKKNLKAFVKFQISIFKYLLKHKEFDVIHASDLDTGFTSCIVSILTNKKFVFDIYDFIADKPKNLFQKIIKWVQIKIINNADATIICTEKRRKQIEPSKPKNVVVIHNTPPKIKVDNCLTQEQKFQKFSDDKIKLAYVGILQDYRLLHEILECVAEDSSVELHIGGFGKYDKLVEQYSMKYKNIIYYGKLQYNETLFLEDRCDIMLAIYDPSIDNHIYAAPNKFYEGLMLGKPLMMVKETGMSEIVSENQIGVLIDYSKDGFKVGLSEIISQKHLWSDMKQRMNQLYNSEYSWEIMKQRLLQLYEEI